MKAPGIYYGIMAVFCIVTICVGMASAADTAQSHRNFTQQKGQMPLAFDLTNTTMQQEMIARYTRQGTDTTGLAAAFQSGNMTDVKTWLEANRPAQMGVRNGSAHQKFDLTNTTMQQEMIARYTQQGTDTTGLAAAFQSGNMTDVRTWLEANRPAHNGRHAGQTTGKNTSS